MENASKALIIAGAILLAIVIISLGLIVVNNTRNTVDTSNLNEQEIQTFNAKFASYEGTSITGARVKTLLQTIIASNQENTNKVSVEIATGSTLSVTSTASGDSTEYISAVSSAINLKTNYEVTLGYGNSLVNKVTIK